MVKIDHIAIAVNNIGASLSIYKDILGFPSPNIEEVPRDSVRVAFLGIGESSIELVEPISPQSSIAKFIEKKGEGLHHICYEVDDIEETLKKFKNKGIELIDKIPRQGAHGNKVAFVHPKGLNGVLVELKQK